MAYTSLHYLLHSGKTPNWIYYLREGASSLIPHALRRWQLPHDLEYGLQHYNEDYINDRVNYYCKLQENTTYPLTGSPSRIGDLRKRGNGSTYFFDARHTLCYFDPDLRWQYLFGDVRDIPDSPTIVKSRSLGDNSNSVLLKLDANRHYIYVNDHIDIADKEDRAIYRGQIGTRENRKLFVAMYGNHPRVNAGNTLAKGGIMATNPDGNATVPRISLYDHLHYRFIMCLEGNDVASNLKWVMSSNSLAVMPRPTCETWFMEGRLQPGVHYVEIRDDFADLIEKMDYYSTHLNEARQIVENAHRWVSQFRDNRRERYIQQLVMQKYFELCR